MNMIDTKLESGPVEGEQLAASTVAAPAPSPLREYLRIGLRWKWIILMAVAGCIVLGVIITLLMTPQFTATTTIEISRDAEQVTKFRGVERDVSDQDQEFYQTQYGLLESRTLAERVANNLRMVDDPKFFEMFDVADGPAFEMTSGRYAAAGRPERQRIAGGILLKNISVDPTRLSRLVDLKFTSPDPFFSQRVANAWAKNFIETNLERNVQSTSYGRDQLRRQLAEYKDRLDESQRQLVTYASQQGIINLPSNTDGVKDRSIVADDLAALNGVLVQATADRIRSEANYREAGSGGASRDALSNPAINFLRQKRAELAAQYQQLMTRFEPGYPAAITIKTQIDDLDASIAQEENRVTRSLRTAYAQDAARERGLQSRVDALKGQFLDLRRRSIQYNIFQQEVDTNQALYDGMLQRFKEIGVAGGIGVNNVAIVDLADTPQRPSSPRIVLNLALSILAGLIIGAGLAFGLEQLDEAITDPSEVKRRTGLSLLGSIPKSGDEPALDLQDRKSELVDAYLVVRTNLGFVTEHGLPKSFSVTSTRPSEGKSTTSLALATTIARSGKKVILVDGDMRSPSVHDLGGVDHKRGLSNFLAGEDNIASMTFEMSNFGITAMSAGPIPPNAAELLTGNRLAQLIDILLLDYDHVVIDSPPVMGLADAPLIGANVEGVVYAVESHGIRSTQIKTALNRLLAARVRVFGAVLTKFEARKSYYGYGYDYGYTYGRQHGAAEEA